MIPVSRPLLPRLERVMPYLSRIDHNRYYTNMGPLVKIYEERLADKFGAPVVATSSATTALIATLIALDLPSRSVIECPSFTFVASALAIVAAGHIPFFIDVDEDTWTAKPTGLGDAMMMVAPFGDRIKIPEYKKPMVIDAAAGFDTVMASNIPTIVSTHATKPFSTAEGGFVLCTDKNLIEEVRIIINHGISPDRSVKVYGINGKMSEYHAALGLAELDWWEEKREKWLDVNYWYGCDYACSTRVVDLGSDAAKKAQKLREKGIDTRLSWYGVHHHHAYKYESRLELPITERLVKETIGLPCFVDMRKKDVDYILEHLNA